MIPNITKLNLLSFRIEKGIILSAISFLLLTGSKAQNVSNTAYATASATIVTGMAGIEKKGDINFTDIKQGSENMITGNSGLHLFGYENSYSISLSATTFSVRKNGGNETMKADLFTIMPDAGSSNQSFTIYAAFNAMDKQAAGVYTSIEPVTIIVNYN